jgi:hypothetical protein
MKVLCLLLLSCAAFAQKDAAREIDSSLSMLELDDNNPGDGSSYENIQQLLLHPINLNTATEEELSAIPVLSREQVNSLLNHRRLNGKFISIYELQTVEGLDDASLRDLLPFVEVKAPSDVIDRDLLKRVAHQGESYIMLLTTVPLEDRNGFTAMDSSTQEFEGSRSRLLVRYRNFRAGDFSVGITLEKDEGEKLKWRPRQRRYVFDHTSFHAQIMNKGRLKNFIMGDYQCQFGQGLVFGGVIGFGKGAETINTLNKASIGIVPYSSAYEAGYYRGIATTVGLSKDLRLTTIASMTSRDGSIHEQDGETVLSGIQTTGLHRNYRELQNRKTIKEKIFGSVLEFHRKNIQGGITFQQVNYDSRLQGSDEPYNQFAFRGRSNQNASIFSSYSFFNVLLFAEAAASVGNGGAWVAGMLVPFSKKLEVSMLYRRYSKNYFPFYNNGFAENTISQNERGVYWGWKYKFNRRYFLAGYFDMFEFPWLKFRAYAPSGGIEMLLRFSWQPSRTILVYVQGRQELKARNKSKSEITYQLDETRKTNYWVNIDYAVHPLLKMKSRFQASSFDFNGQRSKGYLFFQDVSLALTRLKLTARYALFDTEDFDNRQYAYENDVWMSYSLPAYYGTGTRKYILLQYKWNKMVTCWLRYSHTRYVGRETIGSGADMIQGNQRNDIKFEVRLKF